MACASCSKSKTNSIKLLSNQLSLNSPPYNADDIFVLENGETREFNAGDWTTSTHKLLLFFPSTYTPVCGSEMGALNDWIDSFKEQNTEVIPVCVDPINIVRDWYSEEPILANPKYKVFSSYLLTTRLGLLEQGRSKRASVFISKSGEVVTQEYPFKVGRSISELHRMIFAYNTDSYCSEGWTDPTDGFLINDSDQ